MSVQARSTTRRWSIDRGQLLQHAILVVFSIFVIIPILYALFASLKSTPEFYRNLLGLPEVWRWQNYIEVLDEAKTIQYGVNSLRLVLVAVPLQLIVAIAASFGIARYRTRRATIFYIYFVAGLIVPIQLTILPMVLAVNSLGILETYWGLILPYVALGQPFAVFVISGYMRTLPNELEDAARIDGASDWQILLYVVLPLTRPAIAAVAIFNGVFMWNDFFLPLIMAGNYPTVQLGILNLRGHYGTQWGLLFAGVFLAALPLLLLYVFMTKQFIAGLTSGALKG